MKIKYSKTIVVNPMNLTPEQIEYALKKYSNDTKLIIIGDKEEHTFLTKGNSLKDILSKYKRPN